MEEKIVFSPSGAVNSKEFYSLHVLLIKIITLKFQTCLGQGPTTRCGVGDALTTDCPTANRLDIRHIEH
jgi:hypothetical protein